MKNILLTAWFLMTIVFLALVLTGYFSKSALIGFGLSLLALIYSLALWSLYANPRDLTKLKYL